MNPSPISKCQSSLTLPKSLYTQTALVLVVAPSSARYLARRFLLSTAVLLRNNRFGSESLWFSCWMTLECLWSINQRQSVHSRRASRDSVSNSTAFSLNLWASCRPSRRAQSSLARWLMCPNVLVIIVSIWPSSSLITTPTPVVLPLGRGDRKTLRAHSPYKTLARGKPIQLPFDLKFLRK